MMPVALLARSLVWAQTEVRSADEVSELLVISLVVALVVASVVLLSFVLRPLLPMPPPLTDAEEDELTQRRLGLSHEPEARRATAARPTAEVIPFPQSPRDPIVDERERVYRDPIIAERLRHVLEPTRRRRSRISAALDRMGDDSTVGRPTASGPRLVRADDCGRVRHTGGVQPSTGDEPVAGGNQEPTPMPSSEIDPLPHEGRQLSSADLERLSGGDSGPRSNVVPFVPRAGTRESVVDDASVDAALVATLTATVRELLYCANVGEVLHGFALYSDRHLFRFMDETGLTVDEFRATFENVPPRAEDDWTRLSHLGDVRRLADGRVTAVATYLDGDRPGGGERYTFEFAADRGLWLIDDIGQI